MNPFFDFLGGTLFLRTSFEFSDGESFVAISISPCCGHVPLAGTFNPHNLLEISRLGLTGLSVIDRLVLERLKGG